MGICLTCGRDYCYAQFDLGGDSVLVYRCANCRAVFSVEAYEREAPTLEALIDGV